MSEKVIVTNRAALRAKYGSKLKPIDDALSRMTAADKARGIKTRVVRLDDAKAMAKLNAPPVTNAADPKQNKDAIDGVFRAIVPDYLMILGAVDVVPHQDLNNPMLPDGDANAAGDLPYASEAAYSQNPENFTSVSRVVGRLPDVTAATDPAYLVGVIDTAAKYTSRDRSDYDDYFGISAEVWQDSTGLSLTNLFGDKKQLKSIPPSKQSWPAALLACRAHFINCHGSPFSPRFNGQRGTAYPVSLEAAYLAGKVTEGAVASIECCYGGELYDPALAGGQMGICSTYLAGRAYGVFGSSTIAYGPPTGNGAADLLCQFFLKQVLSGASLGRAVLEARQEFVRTSPVLGPVNLKTLAQFSLLGDPSVHPVKAPQADHGSISVKMVGGMPGKGIDTGFFSRALRRENLALTGLALGQASIVALTAAALATTGTAKSILQAAVKKEKMPGAEFFSYALRLPAAPAYAAGIMAKGGPGRGAPARGGPSAVHVAIGSTRPKNAPNHQVTALVATEENGQIIQLRKYVSR